MKVYTVGQINNYIKNIITQDYILKSLAIRGEVSNCKYHSLGHIYFSLKDETGSIPAVMFKTDRASGLKFELKDGQSVECIGKVSVYERDGRYQLYVNKIENVGEGKLYEDLLKLKNKLNEEGLFDPDLKKDIPAYPKRVGIVTASTGAAIQDIKNIAARRNPYVELILCPAKVQGEGAADTIVAAIKRLDDMGLDTLIVGRGGGSSEDLWAFNEEKVVRAIFEAKTPIITGIGHEVDFTLSDYASDRRAPTPSAAAELAIPDVMALLQGLDKQQNRLYQAVMRNINSAKYKLEKYEAVLESKSPVRRLRDNEYRLSELYERIKLAIDKKLDVASNSLSLYTTRIHAMSPTAKLIGGFGYIETDGKSVDTVSMLKEGDKLNITLHDGQINTVVEGINING